MRIKSIRLRNGYKRFKDLTIDLGKFPSRIIALVGPNGCGKSSVFDGMLFLQTAYVGQLGQTGDKGYLYHSLYQQPGYNYQNIEINFTDGTFAEIFNRKESLGNQKTFFSFRSPYRHNPEVKISETIAIDEITHNNYGASTTNALDEKMENNYRRLQAKFSEYRDKNDVRPSEAQNHIVGELNSALTNCLGLKISSLGDIQSGKGTIYFTKPDQTDPFEFNVLSAGEKEVVDILLDLYLRRDDYNDTIFLIDEPELHLNTAIQKRLLVEINKLVGKNCQIWIATHSIGFLRALQDDLSDDCQVIHFKPNTDFADSPHTLRPILKTRHNWINMFETALDDLAGLIIPKRLVYCEGKAETKNGKENGLDAQVYNNIFSEAYSDTLFVSSGGNTEPQQRSKIALAILTKIFRDIEIIVLLDRDFASGKKTNEDDRRKYLEKKPDHRILRRWELENYLYDIEVLKEYSEKQNLTLDESEYRRKIRNIVNDSVKDITGEIKKICGETRSISPEQFKIELSKCITQDMNIYKELHDCIF